VLHPVLSYSNEFIEIWFARGLSLGERHLDAGEFLDVVSATPAELLQMCCDGRVTDSKTLSGMLWLQNFLSGAWALEWKPAPSAPLPDNSPIMKVLDLQCGRQHTFEGWFGSEEDFIVNVVDAAGR
jgi:hypothetical protein